MMKQRHRIQERRSRYGGSFYVVQRRLPFFLWFDLCFPNEGGGSSTYCFDTLEEARDWATRNGLEDDSSVNVIANHPLR